VSEAVAAELRQAHEADIAAKEEGLSELRGENRLLKASIESLERARRDIGGGGATQDSTDFDGSGRRAVSGVSAAAPSLLALDYFARRVLHLV
jgi:hypothetical protein